MYCKSMLSTFSSVDGVRPRTLATHITYHSLSTRIAKHKEISIWTGETSSPPHSTIHDHTIQEDALLVFRKQAY